MIYYYDTICIISSMCVWQDVNFYSKFYHVSHLLMVNICTHTHTIHTIYIRYIVCTNVFIAHGKWWIWYVWMIQIHYKDIERKLSGCAISLIISLIVSLVATIRLIWYKAIPQQIKMHHAWWRNDAFDVSSIYTAKKQNSCY